MSKTKQNKVAEIIRSKIVKNGSRGTSFNTLLTTAQEVKSTINRGHVRKILSSLDAYEVRDEVYSLAI